VSSFADEDEEVSCGGLWSVIGVDADPLLVPFVVMISGDSGNTPKGVVVVGA